MRLNIIRNTYGWRGFIPVENDPNYIPWGGVLYITKNNLFKRLDGRTTLSEENELDNSEKFFNSRRYLIACLKKATKSARQIECANGPDESFETWDIELKDSTGA